MGNMEENRSVTVPAVLSSFKLLKDGSTNVYFNCNVLEREKQITLLDMQHSFGILHFTCKEKLNKSDQAFLSELQKMDLDLDGGKSQSQRMRNVLFVLWKQQGEVGDFKDFYHQKTEQIIEHFKSKLL